jgi:hypothetical protein
MNKYSKFFTYKGQTIYRVRKNDHPQARFLDKWYATSPGRSYEFDVRDLSRPSGEAAGSDKERIKNAIDQGALPGVDKPDDDRPDFSDVPAGKLAEAAKEEGVSRYLLSELVEDKKLKEAEEINYEGLSAQIEYLLEAEEPIEDLRGRLAGFVNDR